MAGKLNEAQPVGRRAMRISKPTRAETTEEMVAAAVFAAIALQWCNECPADSRLEFLLRATIPFRLGNIPGCLWFGVSFLRPTSGLARTTQSLRRPRVCEDSESEETQGLRGTKFPARPCLTQSNTRTYHRIKQMRSTGGCLLGISAQWLRDYEDRKDFVGEGLVSGKQSLLHSSFLGCSF